MKYKGAILVILIAIAIFLLLFLPDVKLPDIKVYKEVAEVGAKAPDFELYDSKGNLWRLSDLKGKVVFMNFWSTWCTVCKYEMQYKESLYEKMQGSPFRCSVCSFGMNPKPSRLF